MGSQKIDNMAGARVVGKSELSLNGIKIGCEVTRTGKLYNSIIRKQIKRINSIQKKALIQILVQNNKIEEDYKEYIAKMIKDKNGKERVN